MSGLTISNNVIIISNPNDVEALKDIMREINSNYRRNIGGNLVGVPRQNESVNININGNEIDGSNVWEPFVNNPNEIRPENPGVNGTERNIGLARYRKTQMIQNLPVREIYVFKTEVEPMIYSLFEKLSQTTKLDYFMVYKSWDWDKYVYYVLVKQIGLKKLSRNCFIHYELVNHDFTLDSALAFVKNRGVPYFIPEESLNHKKINFGYFFMESEWERNERRKNRLSIFKEINSEGSGGNLSGKKRKNSSKDDLFFRKDSSSTRAGSPFKSPQSNYGNLFFDMGSEDRKKDAKKGKVKCKDVKAQEKEDFMDKKRDGDDSEEEKSNDAQVEKDGKKDQKVEGRTSKEEDNVDNDGQNVNNIRNQKKNYGKKGNYF